MNRRTIALLNRVNALFYEQAHGEFSASRQTPWQGWRLLLEDLPSLQRDAPRPLRVLDVGCGNGRFARFLEQHAVAPIDYVGTDFSRPLLALAAAEDPAPGHRSRRRFICWDMVDTPKPPPLHRSSFDLVVLFGVMHHIPAYANRVRLLAELASLLTPASGLLAVTFWRFADQPRFQRKMAAWDEVMGLPGAIDIADLEPNDHLLRWGPRGAERFRYCHHVSPVEELELLRGAGLIVQSQFLADGGDDRRNHYVVAHRPATGPRLLSPEPMLVDS
jgi:SAM-dependent methyltransferase